MPLTPQRDRLIHLVSVLAAVGAAASLWYLVPDLPDRSERRQPRAPHVTYGRGDAAPHSEMDATERRASWSPALFALPGNYLGPVEGGLAANQIKPPDNPFPERIQFLGRPPEAANRPSGGMGLPATSLAETDRPLIGRPLTPPVFTPAASSTPAGLKVEMTGELKGRKLQGPPAPVDDWIRRGPWTLTLFMRFDAEGRPVQVMLDSPSADAVLNADVVRRAYLYRLDTPPGQPCEGWISLRSSR